jgi:acyl-CoA synthetase (AMP-forming)/AMP-acid ligase II
MTSLRQTPRPLAVEPLPPELTSLPATILDLLQARVTQADDAVLIALGGRMTFGEADRESAHLAARLLAAGVGKGTRLGVLHPNGCPWLVAWLAAARIGALTVPLSTFAPGPELARALRHTDVHAVLMAGAFAGESLAARLEAGLPGLAESGPELYLEAAPHLRWVCVDEDTPRWSRRLPAPASATLVAEAEREVVPADQLAVVTTSGATAAPKSVIHTHGSLVRHAAFLAVRRALGPHDRIYSPMPFFWVGGLTMVVLAAYCSGAGAVVQERFEPGEALDLIERERVTQVSCWPNAARQLAEHPTFPRRDLSAVRGGALLEALPPDLRPASPDLGPNVLGMTETGGPHTGSDDPYRPLPEDLRGTIGRGLPGMEHVIVSRETGLPQPLGEEGELFVRGAFLMDGIYKRERHEVFTPDGWYPTGDLGSLGADGHLRFAGRGGAMIKSGGSNVSPAEVEAALLELPHVGAAFVFGVPAGDRGEDVAAVIVRRGVEQLDVDELRAGARSRLSGYKVPRYIEVVDDADVPILPTGKVDLAALRELFGSPRSGSAPG